MTTSFFDVLATSRNTGPAIIEPHRTTTTLELVEACRDWIGALEPAVSTGEVVVCDYEPDPVEYLARLIATMHVGGIHLSTREPDHAWSRLDELGRPWHAITGSSMNSQDSSTSLATVFGVDAEPVHAGRARLAPRDSPHPAGRLLETSGSTGQPKWVYWTQADLVADRAQWTKTLALGPGDTILNLHPLDFAHGVDVHALTALCAGIPFVHHDSHSPEAGLGAIREHRITMMSALPAHYLSLSDVSTDPTVGIGVRWALTGGALLAPASVEYVRNRTGLQLKRLYGATEAGIMCANLETRSQEHAALRPMAGVEMHLIPVASLPPAAFPAVGEPIFRRDHMATEYWGEPQRSRTAFTGKGYRSGDAVHVHESGTMEVLGRVDDVWTDDSGETTSTGAIAALIQTVPGVRDVAVIAPRHHSGPALVFCIPHDGASIADVRAGVQATLRTILNTIFVVSDWPRTIVGKPDRQALTAWQPSQ